jgi:threonine dehydrogenase-like Zn-dependent dehydrogenase
MGRQRGLQVAVFDRVIDGPKPTLVQELGATYVSGTLPPDKELSPDVIIECTGASAVIADVLTRGAATGVLCLAGVSSGGHTIDLDVGHVNRRIVLENDAVFGSVNANRSHYVAAAAALAAADPHWLARLITRRVPLDRWPEAFERRPHDVKVVLEFGSAA